MVRSVEPLLGTRAEISWHSPTDAVRADAIETAVLTEAARLEAIFTVFDEHSALNQFVRTGTTGVDELARVLELAAMWQKRSGGAFNPAVHHLMTIWDAAEHDDTPPDPDALARAATRTAHARPDNLNAIAKGWIADRALATGSADADGWGWLNLGGDIVTKGPGQLRVAIEDPMRPYDNVAPLATVDLTDEAVATSGGARRYWTVDGRRYAKVLDPRSGEPVDRVASASVIAADAATADVLATLGVVMALDEFFDLVATEDAHALVVLRDGSVHSTSGRFDVTPSRAT